MTIDPFYLKQCSKMAHFIGGSPDWVQGGGGNFSIKIDHHRMLIKASGLCLKEVNVSRGVVLVDYLKVKKYFNSFFDKKITVQIENFSNKAIFNFTSNFLSNKKLKASIEVGFHVFLKKYVIHSHSVYANLLNCSANSEKLLKKIFNGINVEYVVVNYGAPGLSLAKEMLISINKHIKNGNNWPEVIFLKNHGIVINTEDFDRCFSIYLKVDELIKRYFKIRSIYPSVSIKKYSNEFLSNTIFLKKYLFGTILNNKLFEPILFPDQVVYLNKKIVDDKVFLNLGDKLSINKNTKKIFYHTNQKESLAIEETMAAYFYIKKNIKRLKLKLKKISNIDIDFINKMESEKYRKLRLK